MYANACRGAEEARERQIPFLPCRWSVKNAANRIGHPTRKVDHRGYIRKSYKVATTHTSTCLSNIRNLFIYGHSHTTQRCWNSVCGHSLFLYWVTTSSSELKSEGEMERRDFNFWKAWSKNKQKFGRNDAHHFRLLQKQRASAIKLKEGTFKTNQSWSSGKGAANFLNQPSEKQSRKTKASCCIL